MLLRSVEDGSFQVVGPCHMHGLMDGEALLGPLLQPWIIQMRRVHGWWAQHFYNSETEDLVMEDPRLPQLDEQWERYQGDGILQDPSYLYTYMNKETGEVRSDPRMSSEALIERGIELRKFSLI
jgi:hypothetical protein